jgi:hypothetical protein
VRPRPPAHHLDVAGRLERVVGAEALREVEDLLYRAGPAFERVRRTLSARQLEPLVREIHAHDPRCALKAAAGDRAEAHHPGAEDNTRRAGRDVRRVDCGAEPGRETACEQAGAVERRLRIDLGERDLRHDRALREGRRAHEVTDRLAVPREPCRSVRQVALVLLLADRETQVGAVVAAVNAFAALRREERDDVVARRDVAYALADPFDDAGALVAEHRRRVAGRIGARRRVQVCVADAAGGKANEHLAHLRLSQIELLHLEGRTELLEDCRANLHAAIVLHRRNRFVVTRCVDVSTDRDDGCAPPSRTDSSDDRSR